MTMKKVQKILLGIVVVLLVLIIALVVVVKMYGNQALRVGIEKGSQKALKVDTRLEAITLKIFGGELDIKNFEIDNPQGYEQTTFMKLGHGYVSLDTGSLLDDTVVINQILLEGMEITIEQKLGTSNIKDILNNLPKSDETKPAAEEEGGKGIQVNSVIIRDVQVKANLLPVPGVAKATSVSIPLKEITLDKEDIGPEGKVSMVTLTRKVLLAIAAGIFEQGKDVLPLDMLGDIGGVLNDIGGQAVQQIQGLIEEAGDIGGGILEGAGDVGKSATDAVQGLLNFGRRQEDQE